MPSWKVHRNVTEAAIVRLGVELPRELLRGILEGVVDPDRVPDREVKLRLTRRGEVRASMRYATHHSPSNAFIWYYFNLSLYHLRRGDEFKAGFMLGRALHYIQDGALSRRRYLVLDVHDREEEEIDRLATTSQSIEELCRTVDVSGKRRSSRAAEALCIALRESVNLFNRFADESRKPVDIPRLRRRVRRIRFAKALVIIASTLPVIVYPPFAIVTLLIVCATIFFRPKTYYEAMKAGLMILKPTGVRTAY